MTHEEILKQAREQFAADEEWEREIREEYKEDLRFLCGKQWPQADEDARKAADRPVMVHNRLPAYVQHVTNEARQMKPSLQFSPAEDDDRATAEVLEGIARHIQYDSRASTAYETASECQTAGGFGVIGLHTRYCDDGSFDQEVYVREIVDPLSVYGVLRPAILRQPCRHAFVVETISREEYQGRYGESEVFQDFAESDSSGWITSREVRIAEYYWVESKTKSIAQLADGTVVDAANVPEETRAAGAVKAEREVIIDTVKSCKLNGAEVLPNTETNWPGPRIPLYAVLAKQAITDGRPMLFSLIRFMRSPQQLINYAKSRIAETLMVQPVAPFIGAEGQFEGHENDWARANREVVAYLEYKQVDVAGKPAPPPHRDAFEPPIGALSAFLAQEIDELKAISNIYDASLGNRSNETSGRAIQTRTQQSAQVNAHFLDNLSRAQEECGRDMAAVIPRVYDAARVVRILGRDENTRSAVAINQLVTDNRGQEHIQHDIAGAVGKYDVIVRIGRTFSTRRLETQDFYANLIQARPEMAQFVGDVMFENSDVAGADVVARRLRKMLPAELREDEGGAGPKGPDAVPPQVQARLQQLDQQNQQLTAALNQATEEARLKQAELDSRERIVAAQEETKRAIAAAEIDSRERIELLRQEIAALGQRLGPAGGAPPQTAPAEGTPAT